MLTRMQWIAQRGSMGRAAHKPSTCTVVLCVAFSALKRMLSTPFCSVCNRRFQFEFLLLVVFLTCFLVSRSAGATGRVAGLRILTATRAAIDRLASDGGHPAGPAPPAKERAPPEKLYLCRGSSEDSGGNAGNASWVARSDMSVIGRAQAEGVAPRASEVSAVMRACVRLGHAGTALRLFDQMLAKGAAPDAHLIRKPISDKFFKLVADNLDAKRLQEDGLRLLDLVQVHGLAPSITTQNCLIIAWRSKLPESVVKYFLDMKSTGVLISRLAYQSILMFHERSDPEFALKIYDEMEMLGIKTDKVGYNAMLGACLQLGMHDDARQLLMQMAERTLVPDTKSYSVMLPARRTAPFSNVPRLAPLLDRWEEIVSVC